MARLRSAVNKAKEAGASLAANIGESSSKLLARTRSGSTSTSNTAVSSTRSTRSSPRKLTKLPVPKTSSGSASSKTNGVQEIPYPSLEKIASEAAPDLLPDIKATPRPKSPTSRIPSPLKSASRPKSPERPASPSKQAARPKTPAHSRPASPAKDERPKSPVRPRSPIKELMTPSMPGSFNLELKLPSAVQSRGRELLDDIRETVATFRAQRPTTPAQSNITPTAATTGKRRRFSDEHKKQFAKMDSIATHWAARRTPKSVVATPQNPQKGMKRTKSHTKIETEGPPSSPSPVKRRPDHDEHFFAGSKSKRVKLEEKPLPPPKTGGVRYRRTSAAMQRQAAAAARRNASINRKPLPAMPRPGGPSIRLVPESPAGTLIGRAPASRPALLTTPPRADDDLADFAPATIAVPKLVFPEVPKHDPATPRSKAEINTALTAFTFKAKAAGHCSFKALSHMHAIQTGRQNSASPSKLKLIEVSPLPDPFRSPPKKQAAALVSPTKLTNAFLNAARKNKRRVDEEGDGEGEQDGGKNPLSVIKNPRDNPPAATEPARKRAKVEESSPIKKAGAVVSRGKAAMKNRIDALATPKRRVVRGETGMQSVGAAGARPRWK